MLVSQATEQIYDSTDKKMIERVFHALAFECTAIAISAPLFAYIMNQPVVAMGTLAIIIATIAMAWNFIYNVLFDKIYKKFNLIKTFKIRLIHALLFEGGLIFISTPLAAWFLSISLIAAFFLDIGLVLFFLPYTIVFNWIYDIVRQYLWQHRQKLKKQDN